MRPKDADSTNTSSANIHCEQALAYLRRGNLDDAILEYQNAIRINPSDSMAYVGLGYVYDEQGNLDEAIATYRKAIHVNPSDAEAHYNLGSTYIKQGNLGEAVTAWEKAIEIDPSFAEVYGPLAIAYTKQGDWEMAAYRAMDLSRLATGNPQLQPMVQQIRTLLRNSIPKAISFRMQAETVMQREDFRGAKNLCEQALMEEPNDAEAWNKLGWCEWKLDNPTKAIECFNKAAETNHQHMMALVNKGIVLYSTGHVFEAIEYYEKALAIPRGLYAQDESRKQAWYNKATAHYTVYQSWQGRQTVPLFPVGSVYFPHPDEGSGLQIHREKALECCQKALVIDPHFQLARILEQAIRRGDPI